MFFGLGFRLKYKEKTKKIFSFYLVLFYFLRIRGEGEKANVKFVSIKSRKIEIKRYQ